MSPKEGRRACQEQAKGTQLNAGVESTLKADEEGEKREHQKWERAKIHTSGVIEGIHSNRKIR